MTVGTLCIVWFVFFCINCSLALFYIARVDKRKYIHSGDIFGLILVFLFGPFASFAILFIYLCGILEDNISFINPFWKE